MIGVNVVLILPFGTSRKGAYSGEDRDANKQNHIQREYEEVLLKEGR